MNAKSIFLDALDLSGDERDAFIAGACGSDDELAARVRDLLGAHVRAEAEDSASGSWLPDVPVVALPPPALADEDLAADATIGAYRLVEEIGDGGFGVVWLAAQEAPVRRRVALKVLKAGLDTREIVQRFHAERQALALMDHPCIARVFDGGATERGRPWFAMEFVAGTPITSYCATRNLDTRARLALFLDTCRAVQHAHQKGVIHRDIKPNNVLVAEVDGVPSVKVIDFGIAKAIEQSLTEETLQTRGDQVIGTPAYMSPEQVERSTDVDTRADVYSLGVLLYELLTGATPFATETGGAVEMMRAIRELDPPRPSTRVRRAAGAERVRTVRPRELKGDLDWIILRCLEKDRDRRYDSAAVLINEVERHLAGDTVLAGPPTVSYRLSKLARRYRSALVFAAAIFVLLVGGIVVSLGQANRARAAERLSTEEANKANRELEKYEGIAGLLEHVLLSIDPAHAREMDTELLLAVLDRARIDVEENPPALPEVEAAVRRVLGGAYLAIAKYPEAEAQFVPALALREEVLGPDAPETLDSLEELGALYLSWARPVEAEELLARCLAGREKQQGPEHEATMHTRVNLATAILHEGRYEEAAARFEELETWHVDHYGEVHDQTALVMNNLASALDKLGRRDEALARYRRLVDLQTQLEGEDAPRTLSALTNLGAQLTDMGEHEEALPILEQALEAKRRVLPAGHPSLLTSFSSLARALDALGERDFAAELYDEALAEGLAAMGEEDRHVFVLRLNRARLLMRMGRAAEVLSDLESLAPLVDAREPESSALRRTVHRALADCRRRVQ